MDNNNTTIMKSRELLKKLAEDFEKNLSKGTLIEPVKFFVGYPEFTADIKGGVSFYLRVKAVEPCAVKVLVSEGAIYGFDRIQVSVVMPYQEASGAKIAELVDSLIMFKK